MTAGFGLTDVGRRRSHNEDAYLIDDDRGLYVVADGVGGHAKGEVASAEAVEQIQNWVIRHETLVAEYLAAPSEERLYPLRRMVESGVQAACYLIHSMAQLEPDRKGMSTTISMALVLGKTVIIGQVGDSRVYLLRQGVATQITEDHTLINYKLKHGLITPEQAARAPGKNVITRAVGHLDYVEVDVTNLVAEPHDRFLLCSDGLHGYLQPGEIEQHGVGDQASACRAFIDLANGRGGKDNITVVMVDIGV
ncbi:MAG: protein phosphatase 2C domain-containing protein [Polyangia bacterium]|jgi:protein phosphatase|nr:protein phosphatase 2C domain-containing protein [Polyangia bacterium]